MGVKMKTFRKLKYITRELLFLTLTFFSVTPAIASFSQSAAITTHTSNSLGQPQWKNEFRRILENLPSYIENVFTQERWDFELQTIEIILLDLDYDNIPELHIQFHAGARGIYCGSIIVLATGSNSTIILDKNGPRAPSMVNYVYPKL